MRAWKWIRCAALFYPLAFVFSQEVEGSSSHILRAQYPSHIMLICPACGDVISYAPTYKKDVPGCYFTDFTNREVCMNTIYDSRSWRQRPVGLPITPQIDDPVSDWARNNFIINVYKYIKGRALAKIPYFEWSFRSDFKWYILEIGFTAKEYVRPNLDIVGLSHFFKGVASNLSGIPRLSYAGSGMPRGLSSVPCGSASGGQSQRADNNTHCFKPESSPGPNSAFVSRVSGLPLGAKIGFTILLAILAWLIQVVAIIRFLNDRNRWLSSVAGIFAGFALLVGSALLWW